MEDNNITWTFNIMQSYALSKEFQFGTHFKYISYYYYYYYETSDTKNNIIIKIYYKLGQDRTQQKWYS